MATKSVLVLFVGLLACLIMFAPAAAGGWATIRLDDLPQGVVAGKPLEIGFTVLQHGNRPMAGLAPRLHASHLESAATISVEASPQGPTGHYVAELALPHPGIWHWSVEAFTMNQPMPALNVLPATTGGPGPVARPALPRLVGILALAGAAGAVTLSLLRRSRWAWIALIACLLLSGIGFGVAASQAAATREPSPASLRMEDAGMALFVAKGCVTCHSHAGVDAIYAPFSTGIGPDLTDFTANADYLRRWLDDPPSVKPNTLMPDPQLSEAEIDALIAFLGKSE